MSMRILLACWFALPLTLAAQNAPKGNVLKQLLKKHPDKFAQVLKNSRQHRLQILYTQIDRDAQGAPTFRSYAYRTDSKEFFYPASLAKLPISALALEKLAEIRRDYPHINRETALRYGAAQPSEIPTAVDTLSPTGRPQLANYIKRALAVSENEPYNRMYEFLGQEYIQRKLAEKGYKRTLIAHRLSRPFYEEAVERYTNPCAFVVDSAEAWKQAPLHNDRKHIIPYNKSKVGKAYIKAGKRVEEPYQFYGRNYISLPDMQKMLRAVLFPESLPAQERFALDAEDYPFLWRCLGMFPRESQTPFLTYPNVDTKADNYMKYSLRDARAPENVRVFNKVGMSFGFIVENAYIVDFEAGTEYMISLAIYANKDETLNDDRYEYESVSKTFLRHLVDVINAHEKTRARPYPANLERFKRLKFEF